MLPSLTEQVRQYLFTRCTYSVSTAVSARNNPQGRHRVATNHNVGAFIAHRIGRAKPLSVFHSALTPVWPDTALIA